MDTATATLDQSCNTCRHYNNGVKETGGMPVAESIFNFFKKLLKWK